MNDYLKPRLNILLNELKGNFDLIASKKKDEEWKRDHYRYTFTVSVQKIYNLLNTSLTNEPAAPAGNSTKEEMRILTDIVNKMINSSSQE